MGRYDASIDTILNIEWQDIKALMDTLDRSVMEQIIELLLRVKPSGKKVITAGCGTSGATAIRVAHSLNVCEVPAFFLDPCMSIHGGCGAIQEGGRQHAGDHQLHPHREGKEGRHHRRFSE